MTERFLGKAGKNRNVYGIKNEDIYNFMNIL